MESIFLTSCERNKIELYSLLLSSNTMFSYSTIKGFTNHFKVSPKTIKKKIADVLFDVSIIKNTPIVLDDCYSISDELAPSLDEYRRWLIRRSIPFQAFFSALDEKYENVESFLRENGISLSTFYRRMGKFNLLMESFGITLQKRNPFCLKGEELTIRLFSLSLAQFAFPISFINDEEHETNEIVELKKILSIGDTYFENRLFELGYFILKRRYKNQRWFNPSRNLEYFYQICISKKGELKKGFFPTETIERNEQIFLGFIENFYRYKGEKTYNGYNFLEYFSVMENIDHLPVEFKNALSEGLKVAKFLIQEDTKKRLKEQEFLDEVLSIYILTLCIGENELLTLNYLKNKLNRNDESPLVKKLKTFLHDRKDKYEKIFQIPFSTFFTRLTYVLGNFLPYYEKSSNSIHVGILINENTIFLRKMIQELKKITDLFVYPFEENGSYDLVIMNSSEDLKDLNIESRLYIQEYSLQEIDAIKCSLLQLKKQKKNDENQSRKA